MKQRSAARASRTEASRAGSIDWTGAKELSVAIAAKERLAFAQNFTSAVVWAFWSELVARGEANDGISFLSSVEIAALTQEAGKTATELGKAIAAHSLDEAAQLFGTIYMSVLPDEVRTTHGIFYTPPALVERLLQLAERAGVDWRSARVLDPACGCGAFMVPLARRMAASMAGAAPGVILKNLGTRLKGFDIDPFGAWLSQTVLSAALQEFAIASRRPVPTFVETRDSLQLRAGELASTDLVVGNPPYGRVTLSNDQRTNYSRSVYGHANMYGVFTDAALRWSKPGGIIAYVTPTSMLSGLYYKALRSLLAEEAPPIAIEFVSERSGVFSDVQQETMLAAYRKKPGRPKSRVGFIRLGEDGKSTIVSAGTFGLPANLSSPWLLPRAPSQTALARRLQEMPTRLADYGYAVSTGPLVWNRFKPQFRAHAGRDHFPVIWAESITSDFRFEWRAEKRNHFPWFCADLPKDDWLIVHEACVLLQRTTAKEQARRLVAAELPGSFIRKHGGVVVENHLNMVRANRSRPPVSTRAIAALLGSAAVDSAFRCINGSVAVSAFELEEMPLPSLEQIGKLELLIGGNAKKSEIDNAIAAMYGE